MATTFMALTNKLLERLNEVPIIQADFASTRGVQAMAKTAINSSIESINVKEFEWPFNATTNSQVLTAGTEDYAFPSTLKLAKWDTFHVVKDDSLGTNGHPLRFIDRDSRNRYLKNDDDNSGVLGLNVPSYVLPMQGFGFTLSPSPDAAYTVTYEYFQNPTRLVDYDDEPTIPPLYDEAIIQGGLYHFYMFRDNLDQAREAKTEFDSWIGQMRGILTNNYDRMQGTILNRRRPSGGIMSNDYFRY